MSSISSICFEQISETEEHEHDWLKHAQNKNNRAQIANDGIF